MTQLEAEARRLSDFEDEDDEPQGKPLHVHASLLLSKIALLWANRYLLFFPTVVVMVVTLLMMFLIPNRYQAIAYLNPPDLNPTSGLSMLIGMKGGIQAGLGSQMGDMLGLKSPAQIYMRQMQSRPVQDAMIRRFHLQQVYKTKRIEDARAALAANSEFSEEKKSGVIAVAVVDKDPNRAAQMANAYPEELGHLTVDLSAQAGRLEREYFEAQLLEAKDNLRHASEELSKFGGQKGALNVEDEGKALAEALVAIEGPLIAAKTELKGLQQIYTDNNAQVQQLKARVDELTRQLAQVSHGTQSATFKSEAKDSQFSLDPSVRRMWGLAPSYMSLYGETKIQEAVVQILAEQYEISKLQETRRISEIQVMDPAQPPERKFTPHRATASAMAGLFIFAVLSLWILVKDQWVRMDSENPWKQILQPAILSIRSRTSQSESAEDAKS